MCLLLGSKGLQSGNLEFFSDCYWCVLKCLPENENNMPLQKHQLNLAHFLVQWIIVTLGPNISGLYIQVAFIEKTYSSILVVIIK